MAEMSSQVLYSRTGVGGNKSLKDVSAPGTRIRPGYRVRREALNVLRFEGEE